MLQHKVLVVATSRKTRGGITSVVKAHEMGSQWELYGCKWIETSIDTNNIMKILYFTKSMIQYCFYLPRCHIVHIHLSEPISALRKIPYFTLAKIFKKKTIIHFHSFSPETTICGKHSKIYKYLFSNADRIIVLSESWKIYVNEKFRLGNNVQVIYNPCIANVSTKEYPKKKQILYAGTLNQRKGYSDLLKAFSLIAKSYPEWSVVFAGNGELDNAKKIANQLDISNQVIFLGWINGTYKDKIFKESTIFCLPSYAEGFPMAVLDAWAYGLPVITTPVGGIPDIAVNGENMLLFDPGNINTLAVQIKRLIDDKELLNKLICASKHLANTKFNIKTINSEIEKLYKELVN